MAASTALLALRLPPVEAAAAILAAWEAGEAVLPLDPAAPGADVRRTLAALRPTALLDREGRRALPGGVPVDAGTAAVVATSGTTGAPKGVELGAAGVRAAALAVSAALGTGPDDRWLACVPLHGVAGLAILARSVHARVPVTVHGRFDAGRVLAEAGRATLVSLVPTMLARLLDAEGPDRPGLAGFRRVLLGGAPVPPELAGRAAARGLWVVTSYGLTETSGGVVLDGRPLPGVELRLGADGEVLLRGPTTMRGYRLDPGATAAALRDGWLATGDLGRLDAAGRLVVTGRKRDLVITGGVSVRPEEVEAVLATHPAVAEVGVAGIPDPEWGERVVAWVVPADPAAPPSLAVLRAFALERLAPAKAPRQLVLVDALPRNGSGKLVRRALGPGRAAGGPG